jgi:malate dehydrogenase (oxaloacetate-decarboxylating)(NADP+)
VFAEGEEPNILRAAAQLAEQGIAEPIVLGRPEIVKARVATLGLRYTPRVVDPTSSDLAGPYAERFAAKRDRKGMTMQRAMGRMITPNYFGVMMVDQGDADAFLSGLTYDYGSVIRPALEVVGVREGVRRDLFQSEIELVAARRDTLTNAVDLALAVGARL